MSDVTISLTTAERDDILRLLRFLQEGAEEEREPNAAEHIAACVAALTRAPSPVCESGQAEEPGHRCTATDDVRGLSAELTIAHEIIDELEAQLSLYLPIGDVRSQLAERGIDTAPVKQRVREMLKSHRKPQSEQAGGEAAACGGCEDERGMLEWATDPEKQHETLEDLPDPRDHSCKPTAPQACNHRDLLSEWLQWYTRDDGSASESLIEESRKAVDQACDVGTLRRLLVEWLEAPGNINFNSGRQSVFPPAGLVPRTAAALSGIDAALAAGCAGEGWELTAEGVVTAIAHQIDIEGEGLDYIQLDPGRLVRVYRRRK